MLLTLVDPLFVKFDRRIQRCYFRSVGVDYDPLFGRRLDQSFLLGSAGDWSIQPPW
jgi:hypothetical protein